MLDEREAAYQDCPKAPPGLPPNHMWVFGGKCANCGVSMTYQQVEDWEEILDRLRGSK
jgi:hypothetical protein